MGRRTPDVSDRLYAALESGVDVAGRAIFLCGAINDEQAARALVALEVLDSTDGPIRVVISSAGGDVDAGATIYDAIVTNHNPVLVDAFGQVQSMAVMILQAGSIRRLAPECRVMTHEGHAGVEGVTPRQLTDIAAEIAWQHTRYCEILAKRSGLDLDKVEELCGKETFMSAAEAVELGLADQVLDRHNPMRARIRRVRRA